MKRVILTIMILLSTQMVFGESVSVRWDNPTTYTDGSPLTTLSGIKIHYGTETGVYGTIVDVGVVTCAVIDNLTPGTYYFAATAYDGASVESVYSTEVSKVVGAGDTGSCGPEVWVEAEHCTQATPMTTIVDGGVTYIYTPTDSQGTATCMFVIPSNGTYYMKGMVKAIDGGENSFYVSNSGMTINNTESWNILWETQGNPNLVEDYVSKWGSATTSPPEFDPRPFVLTAGNTYITFTGREAGTKLDKIMLTSSPSGVCTPNKVVFTTQPGGSIPNSVWNIQPFVTIKDSLDVICTDATNSITLAIGTNPGSGALTCTTNPLSAVTGTASFSGCRINEIGTGYTLTASASGLTGATSSVFNIIAPFTPSRSQLSRGKPSRGPVGRTQVAR